METEEQLNNEEFIRLLVKSYKWTKQSEWIDFLRNKEESAKLKELVNKYMEWKDEKLFY